MICPTHHGAAPPGLFAFQQEKQLTFFAIKSFASPPPGKTFHEEPWLAVAAVPLGFFPWTPGIKNPLREPLQLCGLAGFSFLGSQETFWSFFLFFSLLGCGLTWFDLFAFVSIQKKKKKIGPVCICKLLRPLIHQ